MKCSLSQKTISTEEWLRLHAGHDVVEEVEVVSIKRMFWRRCRDCKERHLYNMETIGP